jgi:hypothetical protein
MFRRRATATVVWRLGIVTGVLRFSSSVTPADGAHGPLAEQKEQPTAVTRIKRTPLRLVEEIALPERVYTDVELLMMAWSQEQEEHMNKIKYTVRFTLSMLMAIIVYGVYSAAVGSTAFVRGEANVPNDLRIGSVVYLDIAENGLGLGRLVIGLLTDRCPLYCEHFHRKCTGSGGNGDSWRGLRMSAIIPYHISIFGTGRDLHHDVPGFNPEYLPTEFVSNGAFRGALASIPYHLDQESPNFNIHYTSGDYHPQIFGLVVGGFDIIDRMHSIGCKHGNCPKRDFVVTDCGELCTLEKSHVTPIPWKVYDSVSSGWDSVKFGEKSDPTLLASSVLQTVPPVPVTDAPQTLPTSAGKKAWWRFGLF